MRGLRISVTSLAGVIALSGLALAWLRYPSILWAARAGEAQLAALVIATLGATCQRGARRATWLGFALLGWGYLAAISAPWVPATFPPRFTMSIALGYAYDLMIPEARRPRGLRPRLQQVGIPSPAFDLKFIDSDILMHAEWDVLLEYSPGSGDWTPLAQAVRVKGMSHGPGRRLGVVVEADQEEAERISGYVSAGRPIRLVGHRVGGSGSSREGAVDQGSFEAVGHIICGLAMGVIGGLAGRWLYVTRNRAAAGA